MRRVMTKNGAIRLWRLGPLHFGEQSRWSRAPARKGMWAFPYPFYESDFTFHKYVDIMPKHLKNAGWEEQQKWVDTVGRKILPLREFWYEGELFAHFTPAGKVSGLAEWSLFHSHQLAKNISSSGADTVFYTDSNDNLIRRRSVADHLEVFIPPRRGRITAFKS